MTRHVAVYVRTSTDAQDGVAQGHQLAPLVDDAARWYIDVGESGAKSSRPMLDELRRAVRRGEVVEVVTPALDRLGRRMVDVVLLVDELARAGVAVRTIREGVLDPLSVVGRFMVSLFGALAEMERGFIRERTAAGLARARAKGTRSGRPIGRPRRALDVDEVRQRRAAGESWRTIAQALKVPARTLRRQAGAKPTPETTTADPANSGTGRASR